MGYAETKVITAHVPLQLAETVDQLANRLGQRLLCSEATPVHGHRRLVAEYLQTHWCGGEISHL